MFFKTEGRSSVIQEKHRMIRKGGRMRSTLAVDIGGTKTLVSEVDSDGNVLHILKADSEVGTMEEKAGHTLQLIRRYEEKYGWASGSIPPEVGIGFNNIVDPVRGLWMEPGKNGPVFAIREYMEDALGSIVYVDNDVKCTVMAENEFGAGSRVGDLIYINVGTGLAAAAISGGRLIRGTDGFAGEVGYMHGRIPEAVKDTPGLPGKTSLVPGEERDHELEMKASGMGLRYQFEKRIAAHRESVLFGSNPEDINGHVIYQEAERGDRFAGELVDNLILTVGFLITNLTCVLSPRKVVLGGGLIRNQETVDRIRDAVSEHSLRHIEEGIVLTGLDPDYAGLMGAAAIGLGYQKKYG